MPNTPNNSPRPRQMAVQCQSLSAYGRVYLFTQFFRAAFAALIYGQVVINFQPGQNRVKNSK